MGRPSRHLRDQLDTFWNRALLHYADVVQQQGDETPQRTRVEIQHRHLDQHGVRS